MSDELKKFLQNELDELKQNKIRAIALVVILAVLLILWITDDSSGGEEIILTEEPPVTKDLPVTILPVEKNLDGVTIVIGANADELFIGDPFEGVEKPKPPPPPKIPEVIPQIVIQPPPPPAPQEPTEPQEKIILTGTAISGSNKTAMFLRGEETLFKTVGEEVNGKIISDITSDFVTFKNGERVYIQKELR